jgi:phenylacetate-CoA ligase
MAEYQSHWDGKIETVSEKEYRSVQEKAFLYELNYVWKNSIFYQQKFSEAGLELNDIKGLDDLHKLPFTEKTELRDSQINHPPLGNHAIVPMEKVSRVYSTSGTTGRPTYIGLTHHDIKVWRESASRALWTGGFRPNSIVPLIVAPYLIADSYTDAIENIGATCLPTGVGATDRLIGAFLNIGANGLLATSSYPRHKVEETFGCIFLEMMGNGDMAGEIWSECEYKTGMHFIAQGIVHPEIINPETGEPLDIKEGTRGELIYTSIDRECMPLIRFRTRDHAIVTKTKCECGRTGFGIRCIGRTDDMLIVQGINVYPSAVKDVVSSLVPKTTGAIEIQIKEQPPEGWKPPIHIKVEYGKESRDLHELKQEIEKLIREKLIFRADIELVPPDSLPKFEYKAKLVRKLYEEES